MQLEAPEVLLCDTSYLGNAQLAERRPELLVKWPEAVVSRIRSAVLAISVITIAEQRAGEIMAGWGEPRVREAETRRRAFLWIPLSMPIIERWAALDAECKRTG